MNIVIYFKSGLYSVNKEKIKAVIGKYRHVWIPGEYKRVSSNDMKSAFERFEGGVGVIEGRGGGSGMWKKGLEYVKILSYEKISDSEHLPVILVYNGSDSLFIDEWKKICVGFGGVEGKLGDEEKTKVVNVSKVVDDEVRYFREKIDAMKLVGFKFSDKFVEEWIRCMRGVKK